MFWLHQFACFSVGTKRRYYRPLRYEATAVDKERSTQKNQTPAVQPPDAAPAPAVDTAKPRESGGPKGLEPTRYGDWERKGIAVDF